jgi:CheY-like chemotaxis protein
MASLSAKILLAGALKEFPSMSALLGQQGFDVQSCADGAKALELALSLRPQLVVVDTDIPLLPAPKLAQILRTNPRTGNTGFFFVGPEGTEVEGFQRRRDRFIARPFNVDQLLAEIQGLFSRAGDAEKDGDAEKSVEGSLNQIPLIDLLQVFGLNRKEGILFLTRGREQGTIPLAGGRVVDARLGPVGGEKALFRLLQWEDGKFRFSPGLGETEAKIVRSLDHLIMEGLRQKDEMAANADRFPAAESVLAVKIPKGRLPQGLRPATQEVLVLLENYPRVGDLLNHCPRPDLEILQILRILMEKGLVEKSDGESDHRRKMGPLLLSEEVIALREMLGEGDILLQEASAKVILLADGKEDLRRFLDGLRGIDEYQPEVNRPGAADGQMLGDVGRLAVSDSFFLRLFSLPTTPEAVPLWGPFCRRVFGVISLGSKESLGEAEDFFARTAKLPFATISFGRAAEGKFTLRSGDRQDLRKLLAFFAARLPGHTSTGEDA